MLDAFLGRQPIFDRDLEVYGYELLFRGGDVDFADITEGDRATSQLITNAFTEVGIERVVGERLAFFNLTRRFVTGEYPLPVPNDRVVLEILEDIVPDAEVIAGVRRLKDDGYLIALDDFVYSKPFDPLLELADLVKLDYLALGEERIEEHLTLLKRFNVKILAEKIETYEQFEHCRELGFDYFQGYLLSRPKLVRGRRVPTNRLNLLRVLSALMDPATQIEEVRELVSQDVSLSYKLLRHVNSVLIGMPRRIDSVEECLMYVGTDHVKSLASLLLLSDVEDKPSELLVTALLRAKMCELLGQLRKEAALSSFFTVGLFSILDALLDAPMGQVVGDTPLSDEVSSALLMHAGPMGDALSCVLAYEQGEWGRVSCGSLTPGQIKGAFLGAVEWADQVERDLRLINA